MTTFTRTSKTVLIKTVLVNPVLWCLFTRSGVSYPHQEQSSFIKSEQNLLPT